jgi:UDP-N-acetyl-D-mannosaminuronic acid dehydrogenase
MESGKMNEGFDLEVGIIGGAGHVGLPLSLMFADCNLPTLIVDIDRDAIEKIQTGFMLSGRGCRCHFCRVIETVYSKETSPSGCVCRFIIIIGTPVDSI